ETAQTIKQSDRSAVSKIDICALLSRLTLPAALQKRKVYFHHATGFGREGRMLRTRALASISMVLAGAVFLPPATLPAENSVASAPPPHSSPFDQPTVWPTSKIYCDTCHFGPKARAKLNLENLDLASLDEQGAVWEKLLRKLRSREMPPPGMPRPDEATYVALIKAIEGERDRVA